MKLNTVIFCLCAGMCSSALIENAFASQSRVGKIDSFHMQTVCKYLQTKQDFKHLAMVSKKFRIILDRFRCNPISISPKGFNLWKHIETLHLYNNEDIKNWKHRNSDFFRVEVHEKLKYSDARNIFNKLNQLLANPPKNEYGGYIIFNNVELDECDSVGEIDGDGKFIFNKEIHTGPICRNNSTFVVNLAAYAYHPNVIRPVYVLRSLGRYFSEAFFGGIFYREKPIKSIDIPPSIRSIGYSEFMHCNKLTYINIPYGITSIETNAFLNCDLRSIDIPSSVTTIKSDAFCGITMANPINLPASLQYIGSFSNFLGTHNSPAMKYNVPNNAMKRYLIINHKIDEDRIEVIHKDDQQYAWWWNVDENGELHIPNNVSHIDDNTFLKRKDIYSVNIPTHVTSIGKKAFSGCNKLTSIVIPSSIKSIEEGVFSKCSQLTSIEIPDNIQFLMPYAFQFAGLQSITLSNNLKHIGAKAFDRCVNLTAINIPVSVTSIGSEAFYGGSGLKSIEIPSNVVSIDSSAFASCSELTSITLGNNLTSISERMFLDCYNLKSITIPSSVKSIDKEAFRACRKITSISIPTNVTSIGIGAFSCCPRLTSITIPNSVQRIEPGIFKKSNKLHFINILCTKQMFPINIPETVEKIANAFAVIDQRVSRHKTYLVYPYVPNNVIIRFIDESGNILSTVKKN